MKQKRKREYYYDFCYCKKTKTPSPSKTKHYKKESTKESSGNESNTCINTIGRTSRTNQQNKTMLQPMQKPIRSIKRQPELISNFDPN
jgi:hypothetical protein